jgi:cell pole-organizing protein PopZ
MRQASEPTVEEILESIKKVIARDNRVAQSDERRAFAPVFQPEAARDDSEEADDDDILDLTESAALAEQEEADCDQSDPARYGENSADDAAPLLDDAMRSSMRESLAALAMLSEPRAAPQIVRSGETSLESLTRELLRPALAEWLEKNLPPLVERLVAAEIARIVGKRG